MKKLNWLFVSFALIIIIINSFMLDSLKTGLSASCFLLFMLSIIYLMCLFLKILKDKKTIKHTNSNVSLTGIVVTLILNFCALPISFLIGVMATDSPSSGTLQFVYGFLFIQGLPLLSFLFACLLYFIAKNKDKTNNTDNNIE